MGWWKISCTCDAAVSVSDPERLDTLACELMELGASSTVIDPPSSITAYVEDEHLGEFKSGATDLGLTIVESSLVTEENWHRGCGELWDELKAGRITVVPVETAENAPETPPGTIKIIPGQGFGTGHHATTRMIIEELSNLSQNGFVNSGEILDVGTGSGILAIAAATLFQGQILGTDIEEPALDNARENVEMNGFEERIALKNVQLSELKPSYSLILANVYGEVLVQLEADIARLSVPGSLVLLSGITELVRDQVAMAYSEERWKLINERSEDDWVCLVLEALPASK